jgi:low temperature requirement protein LtrA
VMQIGRSVFAVVALRGRPLQRNFQRILSWCLVSGALAVLGGIAGGNARAALWVAAVAVDLLGGAVGFYTPGLGRSTTREWTIEGGHFAERCQAFMLIALGESIVAIGATLSGLARIGVAEIAAFAVALAGSVGLWWLYFDRSADEAARIIAASDDPGRLGRSAYHFIHPIMIAGIIVSAAGDEVTLRDPGAVGIAATSWMILGGAALFLTGHAAFKAVVWRKPSWPRIGAVAVLALLGLAAPHIPALALGACAAAVVIAVAVIDYVQRPGEVAGTGSPGAGQGD